jgi:Zn-dependent protease
MPFPPLDGAAVLGGIAPPVRALYQKMRAYPAMAFVGLIVAWRISPYVVWPVLGAAARALWNS